MCFICHPLGSVPPSSRCSTPRLCCPRRPPRPAPAARCWLLQPPDWDTQSNDSCYTEKSKLGFEAGPLPHGALESRRSRNFSSLAGGSTYMINARWADPVLL